ncbi:DUF1254 domain-containing protein [Nocardia sp. NPDC057440]|uniref:DUF1254 domain-containing protein n=1 Tax=Nocardia sp. NPDC057440 TaxID=3346134 RepID=UPI003671E20B
MNRKDSAFEHHRAGQFSRRSMLGIGAMTVAGLGLVACSDDRESTSSTTTSSTTTGSAAAGDAKAIAADAYIFGYPLVLMDATRAVAAPVNSFDHGVLPDPAEKGVVRLNLDTLYSQAWLDVRSEPMVLQVPAMDAGRYWLMQILDAWSNTVHNPSSVEPHTASGTTSPPFTYVITGPGWTGTLPANTTQLSVPTPTVWIIGRIQINGDADTAAVQALQQQLKLVPLSEWAQGNEGGTVSRTHVTDPTAIPPVQQIAAMDGRAFFDRMSALMATDPPAAADADAMKRFAGIGITPGGNVDKLDAAALDAAALDAAVTDAKRQIADYVNPQLENENGWMFATNVGTYGTDYKQRAYIALTGLGANLPQDAIYPTVFGDADDNGAPRRFRIRFPAGQLPPVEAFWSVTAYDADSFLIPNPDNIYAVGHQVPVVPGSDGSVELAVQNANPGPSVPTGNWLPIPASGKFSLTLRLYAPKPAATEGDWHPPSLEPVA